MENVLPDYVICPHCKAEININYDESIMGTATCNDLFLLCVDIH